jgi:hypothetical protein
MRRRISPAPLLGSVLLVSLASCMSAAGVGELSPETLRLESGLLSPADQRQALLDIETEKQGLIVSCMKASGFTYVAVPADAILIMVMSFKSREFATSYGFSPPRLSEDSPERKNSPQQPKQPPESKTKPWGDQVEKCTNSVSKRVNQERHVAEVQRAVDRAKVAAAENPLVKTAAQDWQRCASANGVEALSRRDLILKFSNETEALSNAGADEASLSNLKGREITAAVATFDCSQIFDGVFDAAVAKELRLDGS